MAKFKIQKSATVNVGFDQSAVIGGTGGLTGISGNQIQAKVYLTGGSQGANGSILRSKGRGKFLVTDGTHTGVCTLVNAAGGALNVGEMSIQATTSAPANFYVARLTNKFVINFSGAKYPWKFGAATNGTVSIPGA